MIKIIRKKVKDSKMNNNEEKYNYRYFIIFNLLFK